MEVLITGSAGLVGSRLVELYGSNYKKLYTPEIGELDLTNRKNVEKYFRDKRLTHIVNLAAWTNVAEAEKQRVLGKDGLMHPDINGGCYKANVMIPEVLCELALFYGAKLIHVSTDMVHDACNGPYSEDDVPTDNDQLVTVYGATKRMGEKVVQERMGKNGLIVRTIYPVRARHSTRLDYFRAPLKRWDETGQLYPLFTDQQITIAFVDELCAVLDLAVRRDLNLGVIHATSSDLTTPYEVISKMLYKTRGVPMEGLPRGSVYTFLESKAGLEKNRYPIKGGLKNTTKVSNILRDNGINLSSTDKIIDILVDQGLGK